MKLELIPDLDGCDVAAEHDFVFRAKQTARGVLITRFRGTVCRPAEQGITVSAWQQSVYRFGGLRISVPLFATVQLDRGGVVLDLKLDELCRGSQGSKCDFSELERCMGGLLCGKSFAEFNLRCPSAEDARCLHLFELLGGAASFYALLRGRGQEEGSEQELMRLFPDRAGLRCENRHIVLSREHSTVVEMSHSTPPRLDENDFVRDLDAAVRVFCNGEQAFETELRADHYHEAYAALSRLYGRCFRLERQALDYPNGRAARFTNYPALSALSLLSFSYAAMHGGLTRALRVERILRRLQKGDAEAACIGFAQETD